MSKCNILSLDGGGIRGSLTIRILKRIKENTFNFLEKTSLLAGTSTGSLIALGLAAGVDINTLDKLYSVKNGHYIFKPYGSGILNSRYSLKRLKDILETIYPKDVKIKDLDYNVIITSFKVNGCQQEGAKWCPIIFSNLPGSNNDDSSILDVALSSSAAPIYFPSYNRYIDGGVVANNPGVVAVSHALSSYHNQIRLSEISLLSLGTGYYPREIKGKNLNWGALQWFLQFNPPVPLVTLLLDSASQTDCLIASNLLNERYYRLNPILKKK